ncbi:protein kinase [bacterium]|nr:protein kinase [candidate division CSSED10-310 bacterium]
MSGKNISEPNQQISKCKTLPSLGGDTAANSMENDRQPWANGQILLEQFVVEGILGQGGMGTVYCVRRLTDDQKFAVKTLHTSALRIAKKEKSFLRELRTWIDLPDYPHLVACRFFRTIENRLAIFAEYVSGGSLELALAENRFTDQVQILDLAIQIAWGLHEAHSHGVIHQDVKPSNILLTESNEVKITDFGMSRALHISGIKSKDITANEDVLVTSNGLTLAYCSPEQLSGSKINRKTDIWSFGVTLMQMYTGKVTWHAGHLANYVLHKFLSEKPRQNCPQMSEKIRIILEKCFEDQPNNRWKTMQDVAEALKEAYRIITGHSYPRRRPQSTPVPSAVARSHRRTTFGVTWDDPSIWLKRICDETGDEDKTVPEIISDVKGSRKSQALADIEVYKDVEQRLLRLISTGRSDLKAVLARVLLIKAFIHQNIDDFPGAQSNYAKSIEAYKELIDAYKEYAYQYDLSEALVYQALSYYLQGQHMDALRLYDEAIQIKELLRTDSSSIPLLNGLANAYMNKAVVKYALGDPRETIHLLNISIDIRSALLASPEKKKVTTDLATSFINKATALWMLGEYQKAFEWYDKAISLREDLVYNQDSPEQMFDLSLCYLNKASALGDSGNHTDALKLYDKAMHLVANLIDNEGRTDLENMRAWICLNKANSFSALNELSKAIDLYDHAIELREKLVYKQDRNDLRNDLAIVYSYKGEALLTAGYAADAIPLFEKAEKIRYRLVHRDGHKELTGDLAWTSALKGKAFLKLESYSEAYRLLFQSVKQLSAETKRTGRNDLAQVLIWAQELLKSIEK